MAEESSVERMEKKIESLESEIRRLKRKPTGAIGTLLLALGLLLLALAIIVEHNISAFIGIALTFWGALLLYVRPTNFVRREIMGALSIQSLTGMAEIIDKLDYRGNPYYASPATLLGMKRTRLVIPKNTFTRIEENQFLDDATISPTFISVDPPGQELSNLIEEELRTNFSASSLEYVENNLEKALVEGFELVESFEMERREGEITVEFKGSIFFDIAERLSSLRLNPSFCDPLTSALACILARVTQLKVTIEKMELKPEGKTIVSTYRLH
ncbi:MAG: hypothetical protein ACUVV4_09010 [Candidatus Bathyarchaeia archaeon]